jgi:hypothetical protein
MPPRLRTRRVAAKKGVIKMKQISDREAKKFYSRVANEYERDGFIMSDAASVSSASLSSESEEEDEEKKLSEDLTHFFFDSSEKLLTCKDEIIALQKKYIQALLDVIALKSKTNHTKFTELDKKIARVSETISRALN